MKDIQRSIVVKGSRHVQLTVLAVAAADWLATCIVHTQLLQLCIIDHACMPLQARGMFQKASPPGGGTQVTLPAILPLLSATPGATRWAGPELGQHTDEVLRQELGMEQEEIDKLRTLGAI